MLLRLRIRAGERAKICDDGLRVGVSHVVDVHRRLNFQSVPANTLFQDLLALFFGEPAESSQCGSAVGPI